MEIYKFFKSNERIDSSKIEEELQNVVNQNKKELEKVISLQRKDVLRILKTYFKDIVLWKDQFALNQWDFTTFIKILQKDSNPQELLEMIMENRGISVQKMQFLNQHYKDDWMKSFGRNILFVRNLEQKDLNLPLVLQRIWQSRNISLEEQNVLKMVYSTEDVSPETQEMLKKRSLFDLTKCPEALSIVLENVRYLFIKNWKKMDDLIKYCLKYVSSQDEEDLVWKIYDQYSSLYRGKETTLFLRLYHLLETKTGDENRRHLP